MVRCNCRAVSTGEKVGRRLRPLRIRNACVPTVAHFPDETLAETLRILWTSQRQRVWVLERDMEHIVDCVVVAHVCREVAQSLRLLELYPQLSGYRRLMCSLSSPDSMSSTSVPPFPRPTRDRRPVTTQAQVGGSSYEPAKPDALQSCLQLRAHSICFSHS